MLLLLIERRDGAALHGCVAHGRLARLVMVVRVVLLRLVDVAVEVIRGLVVARVVVLVVLMVVVKRCDRRRVVGGHRGLLFDVYSARVVARVHDVVGGGGHRREGGKASAHLNGRVRLYEPVRAVVQVRRFC